jgi:hypothetical protein
MASISGHKVAPLDEALGAYAEVAVDGDDAVAVEEDKLVLGLQDLAPRESQEREPEDQAAQIKFLLKQVAINRQIERMRNMFTYNYVKSTTLWLLESATCKLTITVS